MAKSVCDFIQEPKPYNHRTFMKLPKITPKMLLWSLLVVHSSSVVLALSGVLIFHNIASGIFAHKPRLDTELSEGITRIKTETDIEKLRKLVIHSLKTHHDAELDTGYKFRKWSRSMVSICLHELLIAFILAYAMYGLRLLKP
jgi:hypothetical protein